MKKFSIKDLAEGRCAVINDSSIANLYAVLTTAFPFCEYPVDGNALFYYMSDKNKNHWGASNNKPNIPVQSIKDFIVEIIKQDEFIPKFGDKVLASDNGRNWTVAKFITHTDDKEYKYAVIDWCEECKNNNIIYSNTYTLAFFKYIKPFKIQISMNEIAEWKQCDINDIEIV